jgi:hypothetical protein
MPLSKKLHRYLGVLMVLPLIAWATTGTVFLLKPGYEGAYEPLKLKTYPLNENLSVNGAQNWEEVRFVKSILGTHLLAKFADKLIHLDPNSLKPMPIPTQQELILLFEDSLSQNPQRYGSISQIEGTIAMTSTKIEVSLNWDDLTFVQKGIDRKIISQLYKIHYLQWTPWESVNRVLGVLGLVFLFLLTLLGIKLYYRKTLSFNDG